ncbi:hypothetical protein OIE68_15435 [Nocardia vinacea]|uniref:hypothetical protein n=1 Tax=Nocardia vinacea TaxID=96468 RepID=UPI002E12E827|nr:hypothetical protein OIE68_15435 [Nocardia vinacea]
MKLGSEAAEAALTDWRENYERRDSLVRQAYDAGVNVHRIHILTGIGRNTIYRIVGETAKR